MRILRKIFGQVEMTWKFLIIYSVLTALVVGLLNCIPFLEKTSLTSPAVTLEYWFVAAIFVIVNCKSAKESAIKTFLFFLISQPLIYLVEVPFKEAGWELFGYYSYWFKITLLTLPGGFIAYQIKKDNILSAVILSVATGYLLFTGFYGIKGFIASFPFGFLAVVFCLFFGFVLIPVILRNKKARITALICSLVIAAALTVFAVKSGSSKTAGIALDSEHQWTVVEADTDVEISGSYLTVSSSNNGTYYVTVQNEEGEVMRYSVTFDAQKISIEALED